MRHLFLIFMIALLPLRGWVGDVMATEMLASQVRQQHSAVKIAAPQGPGAGTHAHQAVHTGAADAAPAATDCPGHASGAEPHAAQAHCESCSVCQACHTVALFAAATGLNAVFDLPTSLRATGIQFASADTARLQKPPIF